MNSAHQTCFITDSIILLSISFKVVTGTECDMFSNFCCILFAEELIKEGLMMETTSSLICLICGYTKSAFSTMKRHLEGKHSIGGGYPCPLCNKICKTENDRRMHVKSLHKKNFSQAELKLMAEKRSKIGQSNKNNK